MEDGCEITPAQSEWARRPKRGESPPKLKQLIKRQKGRCAFSGAEMIFGENQCICEKAGEVPDGI